VGGLVETAFDNAAGGLYDGCFILREEGEGMERGHTNFEIIVCRSGPRHSSWFGV
jgi:hypothetical protein